MPDGVVDPGPVRADGDEDDNGHGEGGERQDRPPPPADLAERTRDPLVHQSHGELESVLEERQDTGPII